MTAPTWPIAMPWSCRTAPRAARAIYLNSPNESNLRQALDQALKVYDVDIESNPKLRYIHRVKDGTEVYFFANLGDKPADASVRLRGKFTPEAWDPHTGTFAKPEFTHTARGRPAGDHGEVAARACAFVFHHRQEIAWTSEPPGTNRGQ